jgi:hypothetical protein
MAGAFSNVTATTLLAVQHKIAAGQWRDYAPAIGSASRWPKCSTSNAIPGSRAVEHPAAGLD